MFHGRQGVLALCIGVALVVASVSLWLSRGQRHEEKAELPGVPAPGRVPAATSGDRIHVTRADPPSLPGASMPLPQRFVVVTTEGKIGFREGDQFYPVGMRSMDFVRRFGEPDRGIPQGGVMSYHADGLLVNTQKVGQDYQVSRFLFHTRPMGDFRAAAVQTDKGITSGHHFRHITQAHGTPSEDTQEEFMGSTMRTVYYYQWGWFRFADDQMDGISVSYMP